MNRLVASLVTCIAVLTACHNVTELSVERIETDDCRFSVRVLSNVHDSLFIRLSSFSGRMHGDFAHVTDDGAVRSYNTGTPSAFDPCVPIQKYDNIIELCDQFHDIQGMFPSYSTAIRQGKTMLMFYVVPTCGVDSFYYQIAYPLLGSVDQGLRVYKYYDYNHSWKRLQ